MACGGGRAYEAGGAACVIGRTGAAGGSGVDVRMGADVRALATPVFV